MSKRRNKRRRRRLRSGWIYLLAGFVFALSYFVYPNLLPPSGDSSDLNQPPASTRPFEQARDNAAADTPQRQSFRGRVISIADGDTLTVLDGQSQRQTIRLAGIDAPERGQPFSKAAKQALGKLCFQRDVGVDVTDTDRYGRHVGWVTVDGTSVNQQLVSLGLAWHYQQYDDRAELAISEDQARSQGRGLWADAAPIAPWEWRRRQR